jgi:hypothetical protein
MRLLKSILASVCAVGVVILGYDDYRLRHRESEASPAKDEAIKQERRVSVMTARNRELQAQLASAQTKADNLGKYIEQANQAAAAGYPGGLGNATYGYAGQGNAAATNGAAGGAAWGHAATGKRDDGTQVPASQVEAVRLITPLSADELAQRVQDAYQRTPEPLTAITQVDVKNMSDNFEWGSGDARRMWHMADANTYQEVYPDGSYSVFSILGHTTVNGVPGVIAAKDDGALDAFIPDKGGENAVLSIRGSGPQSQWMAYSPLQNSQ